ncbi:MAG: ABC transporter substrate-binding protein [Ornithinimicrobium sp.]|uniref:ABC transporter substrate-binding protein n=1 Tax=Ornithinimicrobium sp. TaxID=1977084 RepID=UPI0026E036B4|nr:ABC transporter substrate-binding protein [Ornithinimicrobium sp.]MDO5739974.1 ABC transporter substrate-binding protein [Ornithinimicrobium sp.]
MKRTLTFLTAAVTAAMLTACGSGSPSSTSGPSTDGAAVDAGDASDAPADLREIKVGVIPIVDTAPIFLGQEKGFFEEEGLKLEIVQTTGGAAAVPGVTSGSFDVAFGNTVSVMVAVDQGLPLKYLSNGVTTTGTDPDFSGVLAPKGSTIKTPAELAGKTVAVNNLNNIGDTTIRSVVEEAGGDPSTIKFVEIAFPDMPAALERGQVDAAWILEPFKSRATDAGATLITNNYADFDPELDIAGYFTTVETIEKDPELAKSFTAAMKKSLEFANDNPDEVRRIVGTYTKIDEAGRAEMTLPRFRADFNRDAMAKLGEAAFKYGTLKKAPNLDELLP